MIGAEHAAGYHSHNHLWQAGVQIISLDDEGGTRFGRPQVGVGEEHQNNIAAFMI
jgi:hypothetical protein